eukprot:1151510-Pelagomonas_calceolata.AAC.2
MPESCKNLCPLERSAWRILAWMHILLALCPPALPQVDIPGRQQETTEHFSISDWTPVCATANL